MSISKMDILTSRVFHDERAASIIKALPITEGNITFYAELYGRKCAFNDNDSASWRLALEWILRTAAMHHFDKAYVIDALSKMEAFLKFRESQYRKEKRKSSAKKRRA